MSKKKIGLFGGSFDPITKAHMHVVEQLIESCTLDEVHFVPAYVSYHGKEYCASTDERVDMIDIAIDNSQYYNSLGVNTFEINNKLTTCTADFLTKVLVGYDSGCDTMLTYDKDANDYYFIVGGDNAKVIPKFRTGDGGVHLLDLIPCVVVNRDVELDKSITWCREEPHIIYDIGSKYSGCSSSVIREMLNNRYSDGIPKEIFRICDDSVLGYILTNDLYYKGLR